MDDICYHFALELFSVKVTHKKTINQKEFYWMQIEYWEIKWINSKMNASYTYQLSKMPVQPNRPRVLGEPKLVKSNASLSLSSHDQLWFQTVEKNMRLTGRNQSFNLYFQVWISLRVRSNIPMTHSPCRWQIPIQFCSMWLSDLQSCCQLSYKDGWMNEIHGLVEGV